MKHYGKSGSFERIWRKRAGQAMKHNNGTAREIAAVQTQPTVTHIADSDRTRVGPVDLPESKDFFERFGWQTKAEQRLDNEIDYEGV